eukprot:UN23785
MRNILDWFGKVWSRTPPPEKAPKNIRKQYRIALRKYKQEEIRRMNEIEAQLQLWKKRQFAAIQALPPRLRFTALLEVDDGWIQKQLPQPLERPSTYDPDNYRTWPPYVKSLFEYNWSPGTEIPLERVAKKVLLKMNRKKSYLMILNLILPWMEHEYHLLKQTLMMISILKQNSIKCSIEKLK